MDKSSYETYETDADYDTMETQPRGVKAPEAEAPRKIEGESGNRKTKICLAVFFALLLILILLGVGLILVQNFLKEEEKKEADCDVGPWSDWTSCYLPPNVCGIGSMKRTREKLTDAEHGGEECAKTRLLELAETLPCTVVCKSPVDCKVGSWGTWSSCSATCGGGTKERTRYLKNFYFTLF